MITPVAEVRTAHTADLDAATLAAVRALLDDVFDDLTDQDFEHALGGVHALHPCPAGGGPAGSDHRADLRLA